MSVEDAFVLSASFFFASIFAVMLFLAIVVLLLELVELPLFAELVPLLLLVVVAFAVAAAFAAMYSENVNDSVAARKFPSRSRTVSEIETLSSWKLPAPKLAPPIIRGCASPTSLRQLPNSPRTLIPAAARIRLLKVICSNSLPRVFTGLVPLVSLFASDFSLNSVEKSESGYIFLLLFQIFSFPSLQSHPCSFTILSTSARLCRRCLWLRRYEHDLSG